MRKNDLTKKKFYLAILSAVFIWNGVVKASATHALTVEYDAIDGHPKRYFEILNVPSDITRDKYIPVNTDPEVSSITPDARIHQFNVTIPNMGTIRFVTPDYFSSMSETQWRNSFAGFKHSARIVQWAPIVRP
jgi:hypothetical protein